MMTTRYSMCNHCDEVIMDTHLWTIYEGSIYHWECVETMRKAQAAEPRRPINVMPIGCEQRRSRIIYPEPVESRRLDGVQHKSRTFWDWLFRRKT